MLTKEQLIDAHEHGSVINTRNGNLKIVAILNDIYGVNHFNSNKVQWWMFEQFQRNEAKIQYKIDLSILKRNEIFFAKVLSGRVLFKYDSTSIEFFDNIISEYQYFIDENKIFNLRKEINKRCCEVDSISELRLPTESELELFYSKFPELKPKKYNGRVVKCDTVYQLEWYCKHKKLEYTYSVLIMLVNDSKNIGIKDNSVYTDDYAKELNYEIISFSQYCTENGITEPKWIQGFEVGKDYKEIVSCSNDNVNFRIDILKIVYSDNCEFPFTCVNGSYRFARYPRKDEINEIKFSN
jgi:hypothetical protein